MEKRAETFGIPIPGRLKRWKCGPSISPQTDLEHKRLGSTTDDHAYILFIALVFTRHRLEVRIAPNVCLIARSRSGLVLQALNTGKENALRHRVRSVFF